MTYSFDFGDGQKLLNSNAAHVQHLYTVAGDYTVTLTVTDPHGLTASQSLVVAATAATGATRTRAGGALSLALLLPLLGLAALRRRPQP